MTHASLFSGIGGFDLAARWAGWENLFNCEIDPFCQTVLKYHFPDAEQYSDIRTTDFTLWRGRIDVLSGGFPCQPFSVAGKRKGTEDERHLWPEMLRAIREIQPRWVVGENVLGIVSWSGGMVFEQVCADLEAEGYEVQPYVLPACGVGAPHRRYRTWFVAHRTDSGIEGLRGREDGVYASGTTADANGNDAGRCGYAKTEREAGKSEGAQGEREWFRGVIERDGAKGATTDAQSKRGGRLPGGTKPTNPVYGITGSDGFDRFPTQPPVCSRDDGFSARLDGITFPKWRAESIKGFGNAIVPQVVLQIFETINEYEKSLKNFDYGNR